MAIRALVQLNDALASDAAMHSAIYAVIAAEFLMKSTPRELSAMAESPVSSLATYFIECAAMRWGVNILTACFNERGRPLITIALLGAVGYRIIKFYKS